MIAAETDSPRERLLLDFGWKFYLGNPWGDVMSLAKADDNRGPANAGFLHADWHNVNLPHDWPLELPFDRNADCNHGFKPVGPGFPTNDIACYRRTFELPKTDVGKRLRLEFEGVYRDCVDEPDRYLVALRLRRRFGSATYMGNLWVLWACA